MKTSQEIITNRIETLCKAGNITASNEYKAGLQYAAAGLVSDMDEIILVDEQVKAKTLEMQKDIEKHKDNYTALNFEFEQLEKEIKKLKFKNAALEDIVDLHEHKTSELNTAISELRQTCKERYETIKGNVKVFGDLQDQLSNQSKMLNEMAEALETTNNSVHITLIATEYHTAWWSEKVAKNSELLLNYKQYISK